MMRFLLFLILAIGFVAAQLLGTNTNLLLQWPAFGILGILGVLTLTQWRSRLEHAPSDLCLLGVVGFAVYMSVRGAISPYPYNARPDLLLIGACLIVYYLSATLLSNKAYRWSFVVLLCLCLGGHLFWIQDQLFGTGKGHLIPGFERSHSENRASGFFNVANHFAAWLQGTAFVLLALACFSKAKIGFKLVLGFCGVLALVGIVLTESRAGLASAALGGALFFLLGAICVWSLHRVHFFKILIPVLLVGIIGTLLLLPKIRTTLMNREEMADGVIASVQDDRYRGVLRELAVDQWRTSPAIGTGSRTYEYHVARHRPPTLRGNAPHVFFAHSEYLHLLAEYGAIGLGLAVLVLLLHLINGIRYLFWHVRTKYPSTGLTMSTELALVVGALAGLVAQLFHGYFDFHFHIPAVALLTAYLLGILANPGFDRRLGARVAALPALRPAPKITVFVMGIALLVATWMYAPSDLALEKARSLPDTEEFFIEKSGLYHQALQRDSANHPAMFFAAANHSDWAGSQTNLAFQEAGLRRALDLSRKAEKACPPYIHNRRLLGDILDGLARTKRQASLESRTRALALREKAVALDEESKKILEASRDRTEEAQEKAAEARALLSEAEEAVEQMTALSKEAGEFRDEANRTFIENLALAPRHAMIRADLGRHYHKLQEWDLANAFYRDGHVRLAGWQTAPEYVAYYRKRLQEDRLLHETPPANPLAPDEGE